MKEEKNNVIEEGVVDDIKMDVTSFTTNIPVYQIFEIESDDEEVDKKPLLRSELTSDLGMGTYVWRFKACQ